MDLNKDGNIDILSGSYSRHAQAMAGEFHVFWGKPDGTFKTSQILNNLGGEPLEITVETDQGQPSVIAVICTRPYAVDLNADGKLDIVSGNAAGTFAMFMADANGKFSNSSTVINGPDGNPLNVGGGHSDPSFVDWDGDGDLDMLSGSRLGGAYLFENLGDKTAPKFAAATELVAAESYPSRNGMKLSDTKLLTGPQTSTRVVAVDYNSDGKLDLLVGDSATIITPAKGLSVSQCNAKLEEWNAEQAAFRKMRPEERQTEANMKKYMASYQKLKDIVEQDRTGFVWLYLGK